MSEGRIPQEVIDDVRDRIPIERIIGEYVPLKRAGRHFKGLCPFHKEKTPSFTVNTDLQIFKCFGCGESGNVFTFLMKIENVTFMEVLQRLASQAGVALPDVPEESPEKKSEKGSLLDIMKRAWKIYHEFLLSDSLASGARKYLERRGYSRDLIKKYGFGYAPDQWDFILQRLNAPVPLLITAGLVISKPSAQRVYDRFRHRLMIPIREHRKGSITAFGGRTLGDDPAKYINSPESPIYNKSQILYGLYSAQKAIRQTRDVIIVEGYFDQIALDNAGFHNVVAPCGTSLTLQQVNLVKRYAQTATMLFDADAAGMSAARRALELCLGAGLDTRAVPLPDGCDPDDIIRERGSDGFRELLNKSVPGLDFLIQSASKRYDLTRAGGRRAVVEEMMPFLMEVDNAIDRGTYISRIADLITVPVDSIIELLRRHRRRMVTQKAGSETGAIPNSEKSRAPSLDSRERDLFCFFIQNTEYMTWDENPFCPEKMVTPAGRAVYGIIRDDLMKFGTLNLARLLDRVQDPGIRTILTTLFDDPQMNQRLIDDDPALIFQSLAACFQERELKQELLDLKVRLRRRDISDAETEALLKRQMEIAGILHDMMS
ncbi:MAG TPA: DNA primase [bacterium]|nr:DNA primase [bacterium]